MISDPPRAMLKAWADLYAIDLFEGDTMQDIKDRLTARFLIPVVEPKETKKEFGETQWMKGEEFGFEEPEEIDEEPRARFMNINPYLPRDYVATLEKLYGPTLEKGTDFVIEVNGVRVTGFETVWNLPEPKPKESVMDITRDFIKGRL